MTHLSPIGVAKEVARAMLHVFLLLYNLKKFVAEVENDSVIRNSRACDLQQLLFEIRFRKKMLRVTTP